MALITVIAASSRSRKACRWSNCFSAYRRRTDIRGSGDIGAAPIRRYRPTPTGRGSSGGYRRGADTPISRAGGISVYRCIGAAQGLGDIGVSVYRCGAGAGGYRCIGVSVRRRGWGISVYRCIGAVQGLARYLCVSMSARRRGWRDIGVSVRWRGLSVYRCVGAAEGAGDICEYRCIGAAQDMAR